MSSSIESQYKSVYKWLMILISCVLWTALVLLDPFGAKTAINAQSDSIFMRLIGGPWYQSEVNWYEDEVLAQEKITVILIDNNYVKSVGEEWPMSYLEHDLLLNNILDFQPKAVLYDVFFQFNHESSSSEGLHQWITTLKGREMPIFIPSLMADLGSKSSCRPDLPFENNEIGGHLINKPFLSSKVDGSDGVCFDGVCFEDVYVGWQGCSGHYPSFIMQNKQFPTPAFALYQAVCDEKNSQFAKGCSFFRTEEGVASVNLDPFKKAMAVHWGAGSTQRHFELFDDSKYGSECKVFDDRDPFDRFFYSFQQLSHMLSQAFSTSIQRGKAEPCTYTDTLHATWFLASPPEELHKHINDMIKDRIVLIGTQIDATNDYILSPVNDNVPGVYLHAMALDNYLNYGQNYYKEIDSLVLFSLEVISLWLALFIAVWLNSKLKVEKKIAWMLTVSKGVFSIELIQDMIVEMWESILFIVMRIVITVLMGLAAAFFIWSMGYAPLDWLGVLVLSYAVLPVINTEK